MSTVETMTRKRAKRIEEFSNDEATVDTAWLREEITKLRRPISYGAGAIVDSKTWGQWRIVAGMYMVDVKGDPILDSEGRLKPTKKHQCTQRQAALLALLSLWKPAGRPFIKELIGSDLNTSQITYKNVRQLFNDWMNASEGEEAGSSLDAIAEMTGRMTGEQLSNVSELMTPGKRVPVGNLARLVKEQIKSDQPCSRAATEKILQWLINRAQRMNREIARNYSRQSQGSFHCLTQSQPQN